MTEAELNEMRQWLARYAEKPRPKEADLVRALEELKRDAEAQNTQHRKKKG